MSRTTTRVLMVLPFVLAAVVVYGLTSVRRYSEDRRYGQVLLARIEAAASRQNVHESQTLQLAVVGDRNDPGVARAIAGLSGQTEPLQRLALAHFRELAELGLPADIGSDLKTSLISFHETIDTEIDLLVLGDYDEAFRYDHVRVDLAARDLTETIARANTIYERLAVRARRVSEVGTIAVVMFAALILALLQRERTKWTREMAHRALHDPLTNLPNRVLFKDRIEHALARASRTKTTHAVLLLDLDNFKSVNDTLGHDVGDYLLVGVAERLIRSLRPADTVARLGGDEYAILLEDIDNATRAETVAQRVLASLEQPFELKGNDVQVAGSIGIALCDERDEFEDILANADVAMYASKARGKGMHETYDPGLRHAVVTRVDLESDLRKALEEEQFILQYQPIIEVASGRVAGAEALVRWMHPTRGLVPPLDFIPLAEHTGLIKELGRWVLHSASRQMRDWQTTFETEPRLRVGVNLSARQLQDPDLVDEVGRALSVAGLHPSALILEVTESILMRDTEATIEKLKQLRTLGVQLAVDDFGTGYSSLSYLKRFPIDIIKIDKSFVDGIENGAEDAALVRAIIHLGESLGLKTVAEGIETRAQLEELRRLGCKEGQGFYVARPLDLQMMALVLERTIVDDEALAEPAPSGAV